MKQRITGIIISLLLAGAYSRADELRPEELSAALKSSRTNGIVRLQEGYRGVLKIVHTWGSLATEKDPPEKIEYTHLMFGDRGIGDRFPPATVLFACSVDAKTRALKGFGNGAVYKSHLPSFDMLKTWRKIEDFNDAFGFSRNMTDAWGSESEIHSTALWRGFEIKGTNSIRVVSVFAFIVGRRETPKQILVWTIDGVSVREGVFVGTGRSPQMEIWK